MCNCHLDSVHRQLAIASVAFNDAEVDIFVYQLNDEGGADEMLGESAGAEDSVTACTQYVLPCAEFHGLWERYQYC